MDQFNKKHGESALPLDKADCRLETKKGEALKDETTIESCIKEGDELFIKRGKDANAPKPSGGNKASSSTTTPVASSSSAASSTSTAPAGAKHPPGSVPCKRFGCGKRFVPGQPSSEPCRHHKKPPVFHETRKYWACCPDKIAWDWDSFQAIQGCETQPEHSNETDSNAKKVMGGTELRAEINGPRELGATEKKLSGLDKLMALRASLIQIGVSGELFDRARDSIKRVHEDAEGKNVWDKICSELSTMFEDSLSKTASSS